ncbi:D-(-)-3-hydroxybutyrate oligomer hydrolase [Cupriavidus sp.]|uniref:D-(-)-3-hydroxybutyrate oligomer hydrolase n=1 Tax=Cupriavidus sp. TaxID=1873897 RepID=UPI0025C2CE9F|nr:D-(-)-3-hydroxybutyrate oligomer hydrolase [Cupriavidus sp.]MCA3189780.1 D-(-)-3-hydroxybutyrate oligomer hydrolase [Cupriavidus sp.]MCA3196374.1 D-(-)-3-hydroxybutyrate oligomer hydrolase [Cupriavidus sp.]MCA3202119.1 D-(-)-3-hydroxybutyrate oligomer hydrolase [Cupriavidus sp.]MCA3210540.1 D-(-)-3-hydroxybutyrate oligomer hydrolase [Cupriavidus sp.]
MQHRHASRLAHPLLRRRFRQTAVAAAAATLLISACGGGDSNGGSGTTPPPQNLNAKPDFIVGTISVKSYDGNSDDLLTAGLGKDGLAGAAPVFANPAAPTPAELRRNAIYVNYRAIVDIQAAGGYGSLYGPNVDAQGTVTAGQGKIPGTEYIAYADDGSGLKNVTVMVQIPDAFDRNNPCIISATSSGSRGVYGGIAVGEWGLKRNCAVAYTDKGTGAAPHDLETDTVPLIDGTRATRTTAGKLAQFAAQPGAMSLADFNTAFPHRLAFKHAHSKQNPEADWGKNTLQAIQFAMFAINDRFGAVASNGARQATFTKSNVLVIASAISNGGGAAIAAAEQDEDGLIDGVAVGEPNVEMPPAPVITVRRGGTQVAASGKSLYDYTTTANLFQLCASQGTALVNAPFAALPGQTGLNRCTSLGDKGKVTGATASDQAVSALNALHAAGWETESDELHASLSFLEVASSISVTYANAYSRASVTDRLCNYSFAPFVANTSITPVAIPAAALAGMFSTGNGIPPTSPVTIMNDANPTGAGPVRDYASASPSTNRTDANLDGALCLRALLDNRNTALTTGIAQTYRNGNLRGKPAMIVHGRSDGLLPVNHTSRPYLGLNKSVEGSASKLSYIEVTNGQHFDGFIDSVAGYGARFIPMHVYVNRALDAVYANLKSGTALPPSQVVRTTPRAGGLTDIVAPQILPSNVPPIAATPAAGDKISVSGTTVDVPN